MAKRQVFIDTETTGLSANAGHKIVEIAAVEAINGKLTGKQFHAYLNPGRSIDPYAQKVHGLTVEFLANKPKFSEVSEEFVNFVRGAECLMHNASFDTGFLNAELVEAGHNEVLQNIAHIVCTVSLAKSRFPGESVALDSLIQKAGKLGIRGKHSALEDTKLLANCYFKLLSTNTHMPEKVMLPNKPFNTLPDLIPFVAKHGERYLTIHRVHPKRTYNYLARGYQDQPVVEVSRHGPKCGLGESWMYLAVPRGAQLSKLKHDEKLYVGAQTQDRMFRGDNLAGENFHHAEMRKGNGTNNLISYLRSGREVEIFRISGQQMCNAVETISDLRPLLGLNRQPRTTTKHSGWWFEQYVLFSEPNIWRWNTTQANKIMQKVVHSEGVGVSH